MIRKGDRVSEERLAGNVGGALRRGDVLLRPTGYWTPAVHDLLGYLSGRLDRVPAVLGVDDAGRELVTYLPGEVIDIDTEALSVPRIVSLARWARRFHDVVAGYGTPARRPGPWRYFPVLGATIIGIGQALAVSRSAVLSALDPGRRRTRPIEGCRQGSRSRPAARSRPAVRRCCER